MSTSALTVTLRRAAAVAAVLFASAASAQTNPGPSGTWASATAKYTPDSRTKPGESSESASPLGAGYLRATADAAVTGASGVADADAVAGTLRAIAYGASFEHRGVAQATMVQRVFIASTTGGEQPFELYLDGSIEGSTARNPYRPVTYGFGAITLSVWDMTRYPEYLFSKVLSVSTDGSVPSQDVYQALTFSLPGSVSGSTYAFKWTIEASASHGYESDFSHTARLFAPATAGVTMTGENGFLSAAARPDWAVGTTTTPEPATWTMLAAGALALAAAARRRTVTV